VVDPPEEPLHRKRVVRVRRWPHPRGDLHFPTGASGAPWPVGDALLFDGRSRHHPNVGAIAFAPES